MRKFALIIGILLCATQAHATISAPAVNCAVAGTGTTCGSSGVLTTQVGDFLYAFAFRTATGAPTLPAGWTQIATASASTSSMRSACMVATTTSTTVSGWTNATDLVIQVYRGTGATTTANCVTAGIGFHTTTGTSGTTATVTYTGGALTNSSGTSWIIGASGSSAHTCTPATILSARLTVTGPVALLNDSNTGVTSYSTQTCTGTTGNWKSDTLELLAACNSSAQICLVQSSANGSSAATSVTTTLTPATGHSIIAACFGYQSGAAGTNNFTFSDGGTNTYTPGVYQANTSTAIQFFYKTSITGGSFTYTCDGSSWTHVYISVLEYASPNGLAFDTQGGFTATSTASPTSASITTASGSTDVLVGALNDFNASSGGVTGSWTQTAANTDTGSMVALGEDQLNVSSSSYMAQFTLGAAESDWAAGIIALKEIASSSCTGLNALTLLGTGCM